MLKQNKILLGRNNTKEFIEMILMATVLNLRNTVHM